MDISGLIEKMTTQNAYVVNEVVTLNTYRVIAADVRAKLVVDIGANIGVFAALCLQHDAARVIAVEANANNFTLLRQNFADLLDKVIPLHAAVTDVPGTVVRISDESSTSKVGKGPLHVVTTTLDNLVGVYDIPLHSVLKIDCEGGEYAILDSVPDSAMQVFDTVFLEVHGGIEGGPVRYNNLFAHRRMEQLGFCLWSRVPLYWYQYDEGGTLTSSTELDIVIEKWARREDIVHPLEKANP